MASVTEATLAEHLLSVHQMTSVHQYRHEVFQRTLAEWPQPIVAQLLRTRLAAFTPELSDRNFKELPCASCARQKRICKLRAVQFPPATTHSPPSWLPWDESLWLKHRDQWYHQIDDLFSTEQYLVRFYFAESMLDLAREEARKFDGPRQSVSGENIVHQFAPRG